jgi:Major Facilitator Superfamily
MADTLRKRSLNLRWLLAVLLVAPFMAQADVTIANVATPSIQSNLRTSGADLELVIGGYLVAFAMLLITGARLGQSYGYRRVFLVGVGVFTGASLAAGLAPTAIVLIVARVIQGVGAALMFPQTLTGIQLNFAGDRRARAIGHYAIALSAGAVTGQIFGGLLISADLLGTEWRSIFLINIPIGLAVIAAGLRFLPADAERSSRGVDLVGVTMLSVSVLLVVLPLVLGRTAGWPPWTWLCLAASLPAFGVFLASQRRQAARGGAPLIHVDVLARPAVSFGLLALAAAIGTYYALLFTLAQYLQQGLGTTPLVSGLTLVPWVAAFGLAGQVVRRLPARIAALTPSAGCLLLAAAYLGISADMFAGTGNRPLLIVLLGVGGLALGILFSAMIGHLTGAVPVRYAPDISGVSTTVMQIGGAVAVAGYGTLYLALAGRPGPRTAAHGFAITTLAFAAAALAAAVAARLATRQHAVD